MALRWNPPRNIYAADKKQRLRSGTCMRKVLSSVFADIRTRLPFTTSIRTATAFYTPNRNKPYRSTKAVALLIRAVWGFRAYSTALQTERRHLLIKRLFLHISRSGIRLPTRLPLKKLAMMYVQPMKKSSNDWELPCYRHRMQRRGTGLFFGISQSL